MSSHLETLDRSELKVIAEDLNLSFPGNISAVKLRELIETETKDEVETPKVVTPVVQPEKVKKKTTASLKKEMNILKRVRVSANDPQYKGRNGISLKVGNKKVVVGKFIPFDTIYHIQLPVYESLKRRKWRETKFKTDAATGNKIPVVTMRPSFVIEDLDPLSKVQLETLAAEQAARGSISPDNT